MSQNSLSSSFFSAIAAVFSFGGSSQTTERKERVYVGEPGGPSGVAKYVQYQEALLAKQKAEQAELEAQRAAASGVAKYLRNLEENSPLTGVEKYALRMAIAEREARQNDPSLRIGATGVDKYLKNMKQTSISSVERYLRQQESQPAMSKVAKYMARQAVAERQAKENQPKLTGVAKYLAEQESQPVMSKVAKYMARQALLDASQVKPETKLTGVAKYVQQQDALPQMSKVAKYMAQQAILDAQQAKSEIVSSPTGVSKYVKQQEEQPQLSKVAKYVARQTLAEQRVI